ncbi:UDP-3-O-(3-hydroxymyristoyl)glucosamine N-acyltransferase [Motiliproteus coralliicola]|uniref:UDP-3-O-acylglucosamine N-acyltransferase n=1 Tax=Motiliproteus coralliicola TaxID=2283196 RepID=A0A369WB43_9GAMM|nr:UDP-3-O-(3-hydroxymyristoyl)glucosamine N-acyltransferase [Motiliproteus coralliicola]RDE18521.1 UDP-3-O-(3-hydroxymyristoyl)glucosamine N-acyltransferase [Motiliproteus coralliicola]
MYNLGEIAQALGAELIGDPDLQIQGLAALDKAGETQLTFLSNPRYRKSLAETTATAVLVQPEFKELCPVAALVVDDPYLAYARISNWFDQRPMVAEGISKGAWVDPKAEVDPTARLAHGVVVEEGAIVGARVEIGPNTVVGAGAKVGDESRLGANVTLYHDVIVGKRCLIHSSAVIGADGFGFAREEERWVKIHQIGRVILGDDVEIGACSTVDRGAIDDTVVGNGVKIDNQVMVGHNVVIGEHTAMAGCSASAGSTKIGSRCTIGGGAGLSGHIEVADDVHLSGMAMVTKSLTEKGVYSSGTGIMPYQQWRRNVVRFQQLDKLAARISQLEKAMKDKG